MGVMRIGHVNIRVMDIASAVEHYEQVLGMTVTHRSTDGEVFLKCWDEWDKYSLILTPSDRAGLNYFAFKVERDEDLQALGKRIRDYGIETTVLRAGEMPMCGEALSFELPGSHEVRLFAQKEVSGKAVGSANPDPWPDGLRGVGVQWLDHIAIVAEYSPDKGINKVREASTFLKECLDFGLGEQITSDGGGEDQVAAFLFRTSTPHDIAIVAGNKAGLHHMAFYLDNWQDVLKAADILSKNRTRVDVGPTRHGITRGQTVYFFDPSGNRNETFAGLGYLAQPDMPTITWTSENMGRGIFYHAGEVNEDFLGVYT